MFFWELFYYLDSAMTSTHICIPIAPYYGVFHSLPLTAIKPTGWLRECLHRQREGITGHLEVTGFPFNSCGWSSPQMGHTHGLAWWPYEQTAFGIDGLIRCGYLLDDMDLVAKATKHTEYVLNHPLPHGILGFAHLESRWPHAIFFRALRAQFEATADHRIIRAIEQHYLADGLHCDGRDICNVDTICWLFGLTGNHALLELAKALVRQFNDETTPTPRIDNMQARPNTGWWEKSSKVQNPDPASKSSPPATWPSSLKNLLENDPPLMHGPTFLETLIAPVALYQHTGDPQLLAAVRNGFRKLDRYHLLVDGIPSSNEFLNGKAPRSVHETCVIADYCWTAARMLLATGEVVWADKIERACFNAAMGAVTKDFRAHQYFSSPNQFILTEKSSHMPWEDPAFVCYQPGHSTECCTGNVNRIMPNYISHMWLRDGQGDLVAALFGPSSITTVVGPDNRRLTIHEETDFPFSDCITWRFETEKPSFFGLRLRIPGWCLRPRLSVNGVEITDELAPGTFFRLERTFQSQDRIELFLPADVKLSHWPQGGIALERGPLVFSLPIAADWRATHVPERSSDEFPAWRLTPQCSWNYALAVHEKDLQQTVRIVRHDNGGYPWAAKTPPLSLHVPARQVHGWQLEECCRTPHLPDPGELPYYLEDDIETLALVPYGCTALRLTVFPSCSWQPCCPPGVCSPD
ncbi:MAG: glycoside hydrolase family 127 protein [Anaerolineales bacterium]|nr:glycoside hydrolase family 127 protein [Anaerolineales bacterium]